MDEAVTAAQVGVEPSRVYLNSLKFASVGEFCAMVVLNPALNVLLASAMTGVNGAVLSTVINALGPATAVRFKPSVPDPALMDIPTDPLPVKEVSVTVRVVEPLPVTATVAEAPPVVLSETSPLANVTDVAPLYEIT